MSDVQITQIRVPEDIIHLGIGQPDENLLPVNKLAQAAAHCLGRQNRKILQYGLQQGDETFRDVLARFLSDEYDVDLNPDHLFITGGISHTLELICTMFTRPGDAIIVEEPTYFLALRIFKDHQLKIIGSPMDPNGLMMEALEERIAKHKPVLVYTIPVFHNPCGVTLSDERRQQLLALSRKYDFQIVADEVYQLLAYRSTPPAPLAFYDTSGRVFSLGSFSKILAPGLRLGWIQADPKLLQPFLMRGFLDSGGGMNPFVSAVVKSMIELGLQKEHLEMLKDVYRQRIDAMVPVLNQKAPFLRFSEPRGGYFIWCRLPDGVDAETLLENAEPHKVAFQPGVRFSSTNAQHNFMRLSFAFYGVDKLLRGVERLGEVWRSK